MIPNKVVTWLETEGYGKVSRVRPVGGGCINNGVILSTKTGPAFFLKTNSTASPDMFEREVEGLAALRVEGGPKVPRAYLHGKEFLLMEDLAPEAKVNNYWETFGRQMAVLHAHTNQRFGFEHDNYIGSTPQPNQWTEDGYEFYAEHRLVFQGELAAQQGLLKAHEVDAIRSLAARLRDLIPHQPASILHGDLWSGNAMTDSEGNPAIIDPAVYYGWAEADLAMTEMFGGFKERFYSAYQEIRPLAPGWRERFRLYNLYHLLNHLNLFGRGYYGQVMMVVGKFS